MARIQRTNRQKSRTYLMLVDFVCVIAYASSYVEVGRMFCGRLFAMV